MQMKRKGSALILVTTLSCLLLLVAIAASVNSVSDMNVTSEEKIRTDLEFACESGLNRAKNKIEQSFNNENLNILEPYVTFQGTDADDTGIKPEDKAFEDEEFNTADTDFYSFTINPNSGKKTIYVQYYIVSDRPNNNNNGWLKSSEDTANKMKIEAIAYTPGYGWVGMTENVFANRKNLFMYQIFFENDLEVLPGPNFNLKGLIHTNENMYLNSESTMNIFSDSVTAAGNIRRGRLDNSSINGTVNITSEDENGTLTTMSSGQDSNNNNWENLAKEKWEGVVKDKKLGATRIEAPKIKSFEPGGYYSQNAGISIAVNNNAGSITYDIKYNGISHNNLTSADLNGALEEKTIYDYREYPSGSNPVNNKSIKVTNVDINKLKTALGYYPDNGLIYMTRNNDAKPDGDTDPYSPDPERIVAGFKLVNNAVLPGPATFVSNQPVYVQGDFNKHTSTNPAADTWKPCAVIADSIDLLSNSWSDTKSNWKNGAVNPSKTLPLASNTQYNMVQITGNVPTKTGQYSGGLENFPRFLENWSGKKVDISGGFIQLFRSKYATGKWGGDYYSPPIRDWKAEERFSDLTNLPPGFTDMFPSAATGVTSSNWKQISKDEAVMVALHE
jgi:hypothetical protein